MYSHVDQSSENCLVVVGVHRLVGPDQSLLGVTQWLDAFLLLAPVPDLSGLFLAVLDVAVLFSFLGTSPHLKLADLLLLKMAALLLDWEGGDAGERLTLPLYVDLAYLDLGFSGGVVTSLVHLR